MKHFTTIDQLDETHLCALADALRPFAGGERVNNFGSNGVRRDYCLARLHAIEAARTGNESARLAFEAEADAHMTAIREWPHAEKVSPFPEEYLKAAWARHNKTV